MGMEPATLGGRWNFPWNGGFFGLVEMFQLRNPATRPKDAHRVPIAFWIPTNWKIPPITSRLCWTILDLELQQCLFSIHCYCKLFQNHLTSLEWRKAQTGIKVNTLENSTTRQPSREPKKKLDRYGRIERYILPKQTKQRVFCELLTWSNMSHYLDTYLNNIRI